MYKAIIKNVEKKEDELTVKIEFSNGTETFEKDYQFVSMVDINADFEKIVRRELERMNDLDDGYTILKAREKEEIKLVK